MYSQEIPPHWEALVRSSTELATEEDYSLVNLWYESSMMGGDVKEDLAVPVEKSQMKEKKVTFEISEMGQQ